MSDQAELQQVRTLLVVEDEAIVARDIMCQAQDLGYTVVGHATSGEKAIEMARTFSPQLVLMDIALAGAMDGVTAAKTLRDELGIPCVFLTAYSSPEVLARAKLVQPLGYILKPFTERELQTVLEMSSYRATAEAKLRLRDAAITAVSQGIVIADAERRIISVNPAFAAITGHAEEDILGRDCRLLEGQESDGEVRARINRAMQDGTEFTGEILHYRKDKSTFWNELTISPVRSLAGKLTHFIFVIRDITRRREVERSLRLSEERFRELAENIQEVFWMRDAKSEQILYVSPAYERVWGASRDSLYRRTISWMESVHPEDRERVYRAVVTRQTAGQYNEDYRIVRPDGTVRWINDRAFPIRDAGGTVLRVIGLAADITERKQLESRVLRAQRLEAIGSLANGVAHDINNILSPIMALSGILRQRLTTSEDHRMLDLIAHSAHRGAQTISQLLAFSRGVEGERAPMQIAALVREVTEQVRATLPADVHISADTPDSLPPVLADSSQLRQMLLNLCANAREAMPKGGKMSLTAKSVTVADKAPELPEGLNGGEFILVEVADTGCGISEEHKGRIFEPFFTTKPFGKGSGLGLSTVLGIARGHRGFVTVESKPQQGSTFRVYLPPNRPATAAAADAAPTGKPGQPAGHILVLEDMPDLRETMRITLEVVGYSVLTAGNGREGLEVFTRNRDKIRLVITDVMMPVLNGLDFVRALREVSPDLPVIALSGLSREVTPEIMKKLGITRLVPKPFQADSLLSVIAEILARSGKTPAP